MTRYTIPSPAARDAVCTTEWSWCRWTKDLPHGGFERPGFGGGCAPKRYDFADLVPRLRERRRGGLTGHPLARLMDCAADADPIRLPDGADEQAAKLIECLSPEEVERFERVKKWSHAGAVYSLWGKLHLIDLPRHLSNLILLPAVGDYVLTGRRRCPTFPTTRDEWGDLIAEAVHTNATPSEIEALSSANGVEYV